MIDSHCHLDHEPLFENINDILVKAKGVGINKLLTICTTLKSFDRIKHLVNIDPIIYGTFGIHPHETKTNIVDKKTIIENINNENKIIGVGETGLDFYYNHSDKKEQETSFIKHIEAALSLDLPIIVHSRSAEVETYEILNSFRNQNPKILMHCYTGSLNFAKKLLTLNSYFSASGIITFNNSKELQNTFKHIPFEKLLVETDSPYLAPVPMRGKKNEPSFVKYTLEKLALIKNLESSEVTHFTTENFKKLFSVT